MLSIETVDAFRGSRSNRFWCFDLYVANGMPLIAQVGVVWYGAGKGELGTYG